MTGQQLKNSILQMAVQGKLVPQDPNDEPASVLLEKIRKEKEQLIKEGKIKKEKNPSYIFRGADNLPYEKVGKNETVCIADEVPFDIPDSWEWVRLGEIYQHNTGKALNASNRSGELLTYITTSNLYWNRFEIDSLREMYFSESEIERCTVTKGDLLVCEGGDIGRAAIWLYDTDIRIQNHIHRLRSYSEICTEYYYYIFFLYKHAGWIGGKGIGIQGLSANALHSLLFPLPPLSEQYRIVTKIKEFEPFLDKYAQAEKQLNNLNTQFPDLLKKSILQEAVQGKLVPQDSSDEPASILLERIRAEKQRLIAEGKIKKDKHESVIFRRDNSHYEKRGSEEVCIDDEIPFEIPDTWCWSRLVTIVSILGDGIHGTPIYTSNGDVAFINGNNLSDGKIIIKSDTKRVSADEACKHLRYLCDKSVLVSINGTIGNIAFYNNEKVILGKSACYFNLLTGIQKEFIKVLLETDYFLKYALKVATGTTIKNVPLSGMRNLLVPIPPKEEQVRIVKYYEIIKKQITKFSL